MFYHGLKKQTSSRGQKGVAIILSPDFTNCYRLSGFKPLIIPDIDSSEEFRRFLGIKSSFKTKVYIKGAFRKYINFHS